MISVVPLEAKHLADLNAADHADKLETGRAWAMLRDGETIAAGGVMIPHQGVGIVWTNIPEPCRQSSLIMRRIHWAVKFYLATIKAQFKLERIQADVLAEDGRACQWPRRFGFRYEGRMRKFYQGKDYLRFAWVKNG